MDINMFYHSFGQHCLSCRRTRDLIFVNLKKKIKIRLPPRTQWGLTAPPDPSCKMLVLTTLSKNRSRATAFTHNIPGYNLHICSLVKVLQPCDLIACQTVQENLHACSSQQVHQDIVHELGRSQSEIHPRREAVDTCPQRHGGDSSSSMGRGCKPAEKCNRIELRLRVVVAVRGCIWVIYRVSERVRPPLGALDSSVM